MILLQAVAYLTFSLLRGVRLCCSEPQVLCSPSGSTIMHLEVRLGPAEPCKVSWGGRGEGKQAAFWNVGWNGKAVSGVVDVQQEALFVKASLKTQLLIPAFDLSSETPQTWNLQWSLESSSCFDRWAWLQVKLAGVLCRASWGQLDTSEGLFLLRGISAETICNKVAVVRSVWKFF